jgi:hypothetical protein
LKCGKPFRTEKFNWGENKWGQININFQSKGIKPKGAERFLVPQYEEAPLGFIPLRLEINVDLTPFKKPSERRA